MTNFLFIFKSKYLYTKKYINKLCFSKYIAIKAYLPVLWNKIKFLTNYLLEVLFTGFIIKYSITHFNILSVGLLSAWITYYIEWFVTLIKEKTKQD